MCRFLLGAENLNDSADLVQAEVLVAPRIAKDFEMLRDAGMDALDTNGRPPAHGV